VRSPFVLDMLCSYINEKDVVMALRYMAGGDLSIYMKQARSRVKKDPMPTETGSFGLDAIAVDTEGKLIHACDKKHSKQALCRFYLASTLMGLEAIHAAGFVFRDLKEMNILLDAAGQARIADFGLSADVSMKPASGSSGTKGYWAPEQIDGSGYYQSPDFWTFGVCAFHWSTGKLPFPPNEAVENGHGRIKVDKAKEKEEIRERIARGSYEVDRYPEVKAALDKVPELKSLVDALLVVDHRQRLGCRPGAAGWKDVKSHPYWRDFQWELLERGLLAAPLRPPKTRMNASMPSALKEEFALWAEKPIPPDAEQTFAWWPYVSLEAQEDLAIAAGDTDTAHFRAGEDLHTPQPSKVTWEQLTSLDSTRTLQQLVDSGGRGKEGGDADHSGAKVAPADAVEGGGSSGCCIVA